MAAVMIAGRLAVYVVAPFARASYLRAVVHPDLRELGAIATSTWADSPQALDGAERLDEMASHDLRDAYHANHMAVANADAVLALLDEAQPREGFVELGTAFRHRVHVVVVGKHCLSTRYHELAGLCTVAATYGDALGVLRGMVSRRVGRGILGQVRG